MELRNGIEKYKEKMMLLILSHLLFSKIENRILIWKRVMELRQ